MNAEQRAVASARISLTAILGEVDAGNKFRKWKRTVRNNVAYFWKCPCGKGMRYMSEIAMQGGAAKHQLKCMTLKGRSLSIQGEDDV